MIRQKEWSFCLHNFLKENEKTYFDPSGAVFGLEFEKFFIKFSTAIEFSELNFELNVTLEEPRFRAHPDRVSENLSRSSQILLPNFDLCSQKPDFGKCELFVWNHLHYVEKSL